MTTATSQLNARIDNELKERGNRSLLRAGYTPARAIRALWAIAAAHEDDPQYIERLLAGGPLPAQTPPADASRPNERLAALQEGWDITCAASLDAMGLHVNSDVPPLSYHELREAAALERLAALDAHADEERR